jgi:hypothetical protein
MMCSFYCRLGLAVHVTLSRGTVLSLPLPCTHYMLQCIGMGQAPPKPDTQNQEEDLEDSRKNSIQEEKGLDLLTCPVGDLITCSCCDTIGLLPPPPQPAPSSKFPAMGSNI